MFKKILLVLLTITLAGFLAACKDEKVVTDGADSYWDQYVDQNDGADDGEIDVPNNNGNDDAVDDQGEDTDDSTDGGQGDGDATDSNETGGGETDAVVTITSRSNVDLKEGQTEDINLANKLQNYNGDRVWRYQILSGEDKVKIEWKSDKNTAIKVTGLEVGDAELKILAMNPDEVVIAEKAIPITVTENSPEEKTQIAGEMNVGTEQNPTLTRVKGSSDIKWKIPTVAGPAGGVILTVTGDKLKIEAKAVGDYTITITGHDNVLNENFSGTHPLKVVSDFAVNPYEMTVKDNAVDYAKPLSDPITVQYGNALIFAVDSGDAAGYTCTMTSDEGCKAGVLDGGQNQLKDKTIACYMLTNDPDGTECKNVKIKINGKYGSGNGEIIREYKKITFKTDPCKGPIRLKMMKLAEKKWRVLPLEYDENGDLVKDEIKDENGNITGSTSHRVREYIKYFFVKETPQYPWQEGEGDGIYNDIDTKEPKYLAFTDDDASGERYLESNETPISIRKNAVFVAQLAVEDDGCPVSSNSYEWTVDKPAGVDVRFALPTDKGNVYHYDIKRETLVTTYDSQSRGRTRTKIYFIFQDGFSTSLLNVKLTVKNERQESATYDLNFVIDQCKIRDITKQPYLKAYALYGGGDNDTCSSSHSTLSIGPNSFTGYATTIMGSDGAYATTGEYNVDGNDNGNIDDLSPIFNMTVSEPMVRLKQPLPTGPDVSPEDMIETVPLCLEDITKFAWRFDDYSGDSDVHLKRFMVASCADGREFEHIKDVVEGKRISPTCLFAGWYGWIGDDNISLDTWVRTFMAHGTNGLIWDADVPFGMQPYSWER